MAQQIINKGSISNGGEYDGSLDPDTGLRQDNLWKAYDKINDNFLELYTGVVTGYTHTFTTQVIDLVAEMDYTLTTTLAEEPVSIMVLDSSGNLITGDLKISLSMATGVCVLTIYSTEELLGTKIKLLY